MQKQTWKLFTIISGILAIVLLVIQIPLGLGYIIGVGMCVLLYKRNEWYWTDILDSREKIGYAYLGHYFINFLCMAVPMVVAALYPNILNIFTVALGLLMLKITVTIDVLLQKKGGGCM